MKFSTQEEYGLRCLLSIAGRYRDGSGLTIPEISEDEKISQHNVAKLLRVLRIGGFLESTRGQSGGYTLSRPPEKIYVKEVLSVLGGKLYDDSFCDLHIGLSKGICTNSIDCSVRSLWKVIQGAIDLVLKDLTLQDLLESEDSVLAKLNESLNRFEREYSGV